MDFVQIILLILVIFSVCANGFLVWFVFRSKKDNGEGRENETAFNLLLQQMNELTRTVDSKIGEGAKQMNSSLLTQFGESQKLMDRFNKEMSNVVEKVTRVEETGKQMVTFADQLQNLQDILKNPKQRGILGEYYLETLLKNILPPGQYKMQYPFQNGEIVDAVVFIKDKIIPIDSKFSLENYNKMAEEKNPAEREKLEKAFVNDLKIRIQETSKYIRPNEKTMDFAFMFIPHEAIYYDLLINKVGAITEETDNLIQRAANHYKVIIVSPTSFLAYLQTVLQGLKALQIEETAKDIVKRVSELGTHLKKYEEYHSKLGASLSTVVNHFNASGKEFKKVDKDITRIAGVSPEITQIQIDKPEESE
jgi:DNA recombination protein RmuC